METTYESFLKRLREVHLLESIGSQLSWDQETYMPPKAGAWRAEQLAHVSSMAHRRLVCDEMGELLDALEGPAESAALPAEAVVNVRETRRVFDRRRKLPTALVEELSRTHSLAQQHWVQARKDSDFAAFLPWLEKNLTLSRQVAECVGYRDEIYDALLEDYEPGMTTARLVPLFAELQHRAVPLVEAIVRSEKAPRQEPLRRGYPVDRQRAFVTGISQALGFDFQAGRLDTSAHPFCGGTGPLDVRMTTRYRENDPLSCLYGVMHETGHGLYEQGVDPIHQGTPMGEAVSLGIHESQSRLWENFVGRSRAFWAFALPKFRDAFPGIADDLDLDTVYAAANVVAPSLIRVEADEVTYNLHIILRFEIERDLLNGRVQVADLPAAWNRKMRELLGVTPPDDARGVLQDIHWSMGAFGYFPTYTLGNLYAAQFFNAVRDDLRGLDDQIARGEFRPLREWLRDRIHRHGKRLRSHELVEQVTGKPPSSQPLLRYLEGKFSALYGLVP